MPTTGSIRLIRIPLNDPKGVTVDAQGNIFMSDTG